MSEFFSLVKFLIGAGVVVFIATIVLLSLPKSKFRGFALELGFWILTVFCGAYVVSPMDIIPDVLPIIGWVDDLGAIGVGFAAFRAAMGGRKERLIEEEKENIELDVLRNRAQALKGTHEDIDAREIADGLHMHGHAPRLDLRPRASARRTRARAE